MLTTDAQQQGFSFLLSQTSHIEQQVWAQKYPEITYQDNVPLDFSANEWVKTVTYFSSDMRGKAEWFHGRSNDVPLADISREKFETPVSMAAIGYDYTDEELAQAMMVTPRVNLTADKAIAARRAYEEKCESVAYVGDATKNFKGLINNSTVTATTVAVGAATTAAWSTKTPAEIRKDINDALTGVWNTTKQIAMPDTILLPPTKMAYLANTQNSSSSDVSLLEYIIKYNTYTMLTGKPLKIQALRQLISAGAASTDRMVVYRRSPDVVKMHIPMRLKFLPPERQILRTIVPGIFRLGGVDIRLPSEITYWDGI